MTESLYLHAVNRTEYIGCF